jgi:hypothetical protein
VKRLQLFTLYSIDKSYFSTIIARNCVWIYTKKKVKMETQMYDFGAADDAAALGGSDGDDHNGRYNGSRANAENLSAGNGATDYRKPVVVVNRPDSPLCRSSASDSALAGLLVWCDREFNLFQGENLVGCGSIPGVDIVLRDNTISPLHAEIIFRDGRCFLKDLESQHHTTCESLPGSSAMVRVRRKPQTEVESGTNIRFGKCVCKIEFPAANNKEQKSAVGVCNDQTQFFDFGAQNSDDENEENDTAHYDTRASTADTSMEVPTQILSSLEVPTQMYLVPEDDIGESEETRSRSNYTHSAPDEQNTTSRLPTIKENSNETEYETAEDAGNGEDDTDFEDNPITLLRGDNSVLEATKQLQLPIQTNLVEEDDDQSVESTDLLASPVDSLVRTPNKCNKPVTASKQNKPKKRSLLDSDSDADDEIQLSERPVVNYPAAESSTSSSSSSSSKNSSSSGSTNSGSLFQVVALGSHDPPLKKIRPPSPQWNVVPTATHASSTVCDPLSVNDNVAVATAPNAVVHSDAGTAKRSMAAASISAGNIGILRQKKRGNNNNNKFANTHTSDSTSPMDDENYDDSISPDHNLAEKTDSPKAAVHHGSDGEVKKDTVESPRVVRRGSSGEVKVGSLCGKVTKRQEKDMASASESISSEPTNIYTQKRSGGRTSVGGEPKRMLAGDSDSEGGGDDDADDSLATAEGTGSASVAARRTVPTKSVKTGVDEQTAPSTSFSDSSTSATASTATKSVSVPASAITENRVRAPPVVRVVISGITIDDTLFKKASLVCVAKPEQATHLVIGDELKRTSKLLIALNTGISFVVTRKWVEDSARAKGPVPIDLTTSKYVVRDRAKERLWDFELARTLQLPRGVLSAEVDKLIFTGYYFYVSKGVCGIVAPAEEEFRDIIESGGGCWMKSVAVSVRPTFYNYLAEEGAPNDGVIAAKLTVSPYKSSNHKGQLIVITTADNVGKLTTAEKAAGKAGVGIYSPELVFRACLRQKLEFDQKLL